MKAFTIQCMDLSIENDLRSNSTETTQQTVNRKTATPHYLDFAMSMARIAVAAKAV
jgi:hypothetical protein